MQFVDFGCFKRVALPEDWFAETETSTQIMTIKICHPNSTEDVQINFFRRRQELADQSIQNFRSILSQLPHRLREGSEEFALLAPAMGNVGNNQWTNRGRGASGAAFRLTNAETILVNNKSVLMAKGSFVDPETKKALSEYCGIFVDPDPDKKAVEELFLQVPSEHGYFKFERYLKVFIQMIDSIEWV